MSEALTMLGDFQHTPVPPSLQSRWVQPEYEFGGQLRGLLAAATISVGLINASPLHSTSLVSAQTYSNAGPRGTQQESPAQLTRKSTQARVEKFAHALNDALELAEAMVAEDEGGPLNPQTLAYAVKALLPLITATELPPPLILPLQNGGVGVEWHTSGMNIELRFRKPYEVYAVLEDARRVIAPLRGRDPNLNQARSALRELSSRLFT